MSTSASNPDKSRNPELVFRELIGEIDAVAVQWGILDDVNARFRIEWGDSNITRDLVLDSLADQPLGANLKLSLYRKYNQAISSHEIGILLEDLEQEAENQAKTCKKVYVPVAKINQNGELLGSLVRGMKKADPRRDEYAELLHEQYSALMELRRDGYLPNLDTNLRISNPGKEHAISPLADTES